jgi:eukaryotic-like serine/threonine-protein kinase
MSAPVNPWAAGTQLGPYEILSPIGAGGMGEVWKARDTRLNRTVAIKRLKGQHTARFEQEARAIAALNHPHICTLYDIGPDYLVMEYVEGQPLKGPLPAEETLRFALQMARALEAAHAKAILHRDLKPANVLITAEGAKLLDFGLAKLMDDSAGDATKTIEGTIAGTAAYMSPEQARGEPLDARSDIFSFGSVLYELLSGRRAFTGGSTTDILSAVVRDEPGTLDAPPDLTRIIRKCLRKPRGERYASMADVRAALEQVKFESKDQPSIAVLPFADMSAARDQEYFSDGLAEEIINALVKVPGLKVMARTSAFAFKGQNTDIRKIAEILGVTSVLEGSVRRAGDRIRVTAQLITAADGTHLWSERYDRQLEDIFAVQDEIATAIAETLRGKLAPGAAPARKYAPKMEAYEAVLMAWHHQWKMTPEAMERGRECYEEAIRLDPNYALAYSGYAHQFLLSVFMGILPARAALPSVRKHVQRALELDPSLSEGYALLGIVAALFDYDWAASERHFLRALDCDPVPPLVRDWYGYFLLHLIGRTQEAVATQERAIREDPLNYVHRFAIACSWIAGKNYEAGDAASRRAIDLAPGSFAGYHYLALSLAAQGRWEEALASAETSFSLAPSVPMCVGMLAGVAFRTGDDRRSQELLRALGDGNGFESSHVIAHLIRGDLPQAAQWAVRSIEDRDPNLPFMLVHPLARPLRRSEHWPPLARMMNLPEAS